MSKSTKVTLERARENIGEKVVYRSPAMRDGRDGRPAEEGVITSVGETYIHVRYGTNVGSAATLPDDLEFISAR